MKELHVFFEVCFDPMYWLKIDLQNLKLSLSVDTFEKFFGVDENIQKKKS
jgi:hypothetical protein